MVVVKSPAATVVEPVGLSVGEDPVDEETVEPALEVVISFAVVVVKPF